MWLWRASAGPMLAYVGHMLDLLGLCWVVVVVVVVGLCWAYVGLCWAYFGPMLAHVGAMLGVSLLYVGPMLGRQMWMYWYF